MRNLYFAAVCGIICDSYNTWFYDNGCNVLACINNKNGEIVEWISFDGVSFLGCSSIKKYRDKLILIPLLGKDIIVYDIMSRAMNRISIYGIDCKYPAFVDGFIVGDNLYLLPHNQNNGLIYICNMTNNTCEAAQVINEMILTLTDNRQFRCSRIYDGGDKFYWIIVNEGILVSFNKNDEHIETKKINLPCRFSGIIVTDSLLMGLDWKESIVYYYDLLNAKLIKTNQLICDDDKNSCYMNTGRINNNWFIFPLYGRSIAKIDIGNTELVDYFSAPEAKSLYCPMYIGENVDKRLLVLSAKNRMIGTYEERTQEWIWKKFTGIASRKIEYEQKEIQLSNWIDFFEKLKHVCEEV